MLEYGEHRDVVANYARAEGKQSIAEEAEHKSVENEADDSGPDGVSTSGERLRHSTAGVDKAKLRVSIEQEISDHCTGGEIVWAPARGYDLSPYTVSAGEAKYACDDYHSQHYYCHDA